MSRPGSAVVIGGGIVGLSAALALAERGLDVRLVDDAPAVAPASAGNAGHIAIEQSAPLASLSTLRALPRRLAVFGGPAVFPLSSVGAWLPFGFRLLAASMPARFRAGEAALTALLARALPAWRRRLAAAGAEDLLREAGHLVAWESAASAVRGRRAALAGAAGPVTCTDIGAEDAALLDAAVPGRIAGAVRYRGTASVADPAAVLDALRRALLAAGGRMETGHVTSLARALDDAEVAVVAAGVRSAALMRALGHPVPMIAERGYHVEAPSRVWPTGLPPVVFEDRSVVANGFTRGLRLTGFVEFGRPDAPPDPRLWRRLEEHARGLGIAFDRTADRWCGARPTLPDYLPAIGRSRRDHRVIYAFGHQHLGLTLGPLTGDLVADLATGRRPSVDLTPFAIDRFGRG